jgi:hypothetical protein
MLAFAMRPETAALRHAPAHLQIHGTHFTHADGSIFQWRGVTAFRLLEMIARGRTAEVEAFLDWCSASRLTVVRVLTMAKHVFELTPEDGRAALPRLLALAAARGLHVEIVALADTAEIAVDIDAHVREVGAIAARHPNALIEVANEPAHATQSTRIHNPAELARLAALVPEVVPAALGSVEGDARLAADYITWHAPRETGNGGWNHVLEIAAGADLLRRFRKPVVSDEPIGAGAAFDPGRRDDNADRFRAAALLTRLAGLGATFHYESGLHARIPAGRELQCFNAWNEAWDLLPAGIEHRGIFRRAGADGAAVRAFNRRAALGVFERQDGAQAWVLVIHPTAEPALQWAEGWSVRSTRRLGGVHIITAARRM